MDIQTIRLMFRPFRPNSGPNLSNLNYFLFQSYKQQKGQSISDLAMKVERLAHATFGDCPIKTRDRLAASQFVSSLTNEEMKRMLRLGGFTNLRAALVRDRSRFHNFLVKMRPSPFFNSYPPKRNGQCRIKESPGTDQGRTARCSFVERPLKCWRCGKIRHLERNCFTKKKKEEGNSKQSS